MYEVDPEFKQDKLVKGRLYRFHARNFSYGVYDGNGGFIGIREKFYDHYLFTEYHADPPWGGTVFGISNWRDDLFEQVPNDIEIREYFDARCGQCEQLTEFVPDTPGTHAPGKQYHRDRTLDEDHDPHGQVYLPSNKRLLGWLALFEEDEYLRNYLLRLAAATPEQAAELQDAFVARRKEQIAAHHAEMEQAAESRKMAPQTWHEWQMELLWEWKREEAKKFEHHLSGEELKAASKALFQEYSKRAVAISKESEARRRG
jgi:hypothetical protein